MNSDPKKTYEVYALPLTTENVSLASEYRFMRATASPAPGYVLVYTEQEPPEGSIHIDEDKAQMLTDTDWRWLMASRTELIAEALEEHASETLEDLSNTVAALERELQRKKRELEAEGE